MLQLLIKTNNKIYLLLLICFRKITAKKNDFFKNKKLLISNFYRENSSQKCRQKNIIYKIKSLLILFFFLNSILK